MASLTNQEFLSACFGTAGTRAHVTGFDEDPGNLESLGLSWRWAGDKFGRLDPKTLVGTNSYFTISTFKDDPTDGRARRRKALFDATYVIVVDDVGTKVSETDKLPPPSWILETSPGNYQWGYILDMPERDAGRVNALLDGMVKLGLCPDGKDPGMKGVTRYARLPEGRNTKAKYGAQGFACVMTEWAPGVRYTMDELAAPWGIDLPLPGTVSGTVVKVDIAPEDDEIFKWLNAWSMIQGPAADGDGFLMTCPWIDEHTGRSDSGAAYWLGGGFKCHHGHCADKGRKALERWVDEKLREESAGLKCLPAWAFTPVAPQAGMGTGTSTGVAAGTGSRPPADEFFDELVYLSSDDRFLSTRTGETLTRIAADCTWGARLRAVGALPLDGRRVMDPARWYLDEDNMGRARIADRLTYWPGQPVFFTDEGAQLANRWRGPERYPFTVTDAEVKPWLDLVGHIVGGEGAHIVEAVLDWMALVVAEPGVKPGWHVVVQGGQGVGKDMMIQPVIAGVGRENVGTVNAISLHSPFNAWAERRLVIVNELKSTTRGSATGADQYTTLKEMTENTNARLKINQKNMKEYYARNTGAFYVTSNDDRAVALEQDDRRFLVVMTTALPLAKSVYRQIAAWLERGGRAKAAEWLWQRREAMSAVRRADLDGNAPMTPGKARMIHNNEDPVVTWMRDQIETGAWPDLMTSQEIGAALSAAARTGGGFNYVPSPHKWGSILRSLGGDKVYAGEPVRLKNGSRVRVWAVRAPGRFDGMGEAQIATAIVTVAANAFKDVDDGKVVSITSVKEDPSH
jgi:hypothetical protein